MHLAPWANAFHSRVIIFNLIETPAIYMSGLNGNWKPQSKNLDSMMENVEKSRQKKANSWSAILAEQNVVAQLLNRRQKNSLDSEILDSAKKNNVSVIALASNSGPFAQTVLGSVARDVLLQAKCPVLIFHRPRSFRDISPVKKQFASKTQVGLNESAVSAGL